MFSLSFKEQNTKLWDIIPILKAKCMGKKSLQILYQNVSCCTWVNEILGVFFSVWLYYFHNKIS